MRFLMLFWVLSIFGANAQEDASSLNSDSTEPKMISAPSKLAKREGRVLSLTLESKRTLKLVDGKTCEIIDQCRLHRLLGLSPDRQFFAIEVSGHEWGTVEWISRKTGIRYDVYTEPKASPDGKWIVSASPAECCGTNGVFVWQIRNGHLINKLDLRPQIYALYTFVGWKGNRKFMLKKFTEADRSVCPDGQFMELDVTVTNIGGLWKLDEKDGLNTARCK